MHTWLESSIWLIRQTACIYTGEHKRDDANSERNDVHSGCSHFRFSNKTPEQLLQKERAIKKPVSYALT